MAWTALMTFTANSVLTAAQLNTYIGTGGNLSHTAPAVVTTAGDLVYGTAANTITRLGIGAATTHMVSTGSEPVWRGIDVATNTNSSTITSTSYGDLATGAPGPAVSVATGTTALVGVTAQCENSTTAQCFMSFAVSGATTLAADDVRAFRFKSSTAADPGAYAFVALQPGLTTGTNTFTAKYRVTAGTGTFVNRRIWAIGF